MCRTLGVVHRPMMVVQRNSHRLRNRIQLKTVQTRQKEPCHRNRICGRKLPLDPLKLTVSLNKTHIKSRIVSHHHSSFAELHEFRQYLLNHRRVHHHAVVDMGQRLNPKRNRRLRIDKRRKAVHNLSLFHAHRPDLNDLVHHRRKSRGLNIEHNVAAVQLLPPAVDHDIFQVVHQISLHSIDHLERSRNLFQFLLGDLRMLLLVFFPVGAVDIFHRMVRLGKRLDDTVIRNGNGRMPPFVGTPDQLRRVGDSVHIAHLRMTVEFHPLHRAGISSSDAEIAALFDSHDGHDRQLAVKGIHRRAAFQLHKSSRLYRRGQLRNLLVFQKNFHADGIRKIRDREHENCSLVPDFPLIHALNFSADHNIPDFLPDSCNLHAFLVKVAAVDHIRIERTAILSIVEPTSPEAAGASLVPVKLPLSVSS